MGLAIDWATVHEVLSYVITAAVSIVGSAYVVLIGLVLLALPIIVPAFLILRLGEPD